MNCTCMGSRIYIHIYIPPHVTLKIGNFLSREKAAMLIITGILIYVRINIRFRSRVFVLVAIGCSIKIKEVFILNLRRLLSGHAGMFRWGPNGVAGAWQ